MLFIHESVKDQVKKFVSLGFEFITMYVQFNERPDHEDILLQVREVAPVPDTVHQLSAIGAEAVVKDQENEVEFPKSSFRMRLNI